MQAGGGLRVDLPQLAQQRGVPLLFRTPLQRLANRGVGFDFFKMDVVKQRADIQAGSARQHRQMAAQSDFADTAARALHKFGHAERFIRLEDTD